MPLCWWFPIYSHLGWPCYTIQLGTWSAESLIGCHPLCHLAILGCSGFPCNMFLLWLWPQIPWYGNQQVPHWQPIKGRCGSCQIAVVLWFSWVALEDHGSHSTCLSHCKTNAMVFWFYAVLHSVEWWVQSQVHIRVTLPHLPSLSTVLATTDGLGFPCSPFVISITKRTVTNNVPTTKPAPWTVVIGWSSTSNALLIYNPHTNNSTNPTVIASTPNPFLLHSILSSSTTAAFTAISFATRIPTWRRSNLQEHGLNGSSPPPILFCQVLLWTSLSLLRLPTALLASFHTPSLLTMVPPHLFLYRIWLHWFLLLRLILQSSSQDSLLMQFLWLNSKITYEHGGQHHKGYLTKRGGYYWFLFKSHINKQKKAGALTSQIWSWSGLISVSKVSWFLGISHTHSFACHLP